MDRDPFPRRHSGAFLVSSETRGLPIPRSPMGPPDGVAMRKSDRSPVQIPVEFTPWDPRHLAFGVVTNVSLGGIHVETAFPSPPGSDLVVVVWRPGWKEEVLLAGIVCWSTAEGMGLRFASEGEHEANAVSAMLAAPDRDAAVARRSS